MTTQDPVHGVTCGACGRKTWNIEERCGCCIQMVARDDLDGRFADDRLARRHQSLPRCYSCGYVRDRLDLPPSAHGKPDEPLAISGVGADTLPTPALHALIAARHDLDTGRPERSAELVLTGAWALEDAGRPEDAMPVFRQAGDILEAALAAERHSPPAAVGAASDGDSTGREFLAKRWLLLADVRRRGGQFESARAVLDQCKEQIESAAKTTDPFQLRARFQAEQWAIEQGTTAPVSGEMAMAMWTDAENRVAIATADPDTWRACGLPDRATLLAKGGVDGAVERCRSASRFPGLVEKLNSDRRHRYLGQLAARRAATAGRIYEAAASFPQLADALVRFSGPRDFTRRAIMVLDKAEVITDPSELLRLVRSHQHDACPRCGMTYGLRCAEGASECGHCGWREQSAGAPSVA